MQQRQIPILIPSSRSILQLYIIIAIQLQGVPSILTQKFRTTLMGHSVHILPTYNSSAKTLGQKKSNERLFSILLCNLEIFFHKLFFLCFQHFTMQQVKYIHTNLVSVERKKKSLIHLFKRAELNQAFNFLTATLAFAVQRISLQFVAVIRTFFIQGQRRLTIFFLIN